MVLLGQKLSLRLEADSVKHSTDTWLKLVKFTNLEKLEVQNCAGTDVVFAQLSKAHLSPQKLKILRWMDEGRCEPHALDTLNGFIESLSVLKIIDIYLERMNNLPKADAIVHHKETLTSLSVHSQSHSNDAHAYTEEDFARICDECSKIRQLSVMFPLTSLEQAFPSAEFRAFLVCLFVPLSLPPSTPSSRPQHPSPEISKPNHLTRTRRLRPQQNSARKLPSLTTLNIRRWPMHSHSFTGCWHRITQTLSIYEHHLQRLTQRIFEKADERARDHGVGLGHRAALAVLAWGPNGRSHVDGSDTHKLKQIPFVRGKKVDPFGGESMLAVQTTWKMVQFVEPESDILNHSVSGGQLCLRSGEEDI